jgi:hypothetical protein
MTRSTIARTSIAAVLTLLACTSFAAQETTQDKHPAPATKQEREQLATLHEHMAACLRSDKTMRECHEAARKECEDTLGDRCRDMMRAMMGMQHRMNKQRENGEKPVRPQE